MKKTIMDELNLMNRVDMCRAYAQAKAPCVDWSEAEVTEERYLIIMLGPDHNELVFTPHDVVTWATMKFQESLLNVMF